jgi:cell division inhibitor SepF
MSALRKAGVWLGLIEDESDAAFDEREFASGTRERRRPRQRDGGRRYEDDYADDEDPPQRSMRVDGRGDGGRADPGRADGGRGDGSRPTERVPTRRAERDGGEQRGTVRSITRDSSVSYLTRDNLALAPEPPPPAPAPSPPVTASDERRYQITTLHPTTYREARTIGEHFRDGTPVILNLTEMDEADARRLVDFGAGLAFGLRGTMERVTNRVFLLSPANVHVTAEDKAKIAEGEFFRHR